MPHQVHPVPAKPHTLGKQSLPSGRHALEPRGPLLAKVGYRFTMDLQPRGFTAASGTSFGTESQSTCNPYLWAWASMSRGRIWGRHARRVAGVAGLGLVLGFALGAAQLVPTLSYVQSSYRLHLRQTQQGEPIRLYPI